MAERVSPCTACETPCTYPACEAYRSYIRFRWSRYARWKKPAPQKRDCFRYAPPYLIEDSLKVCPCVGCIRERTCADDTFCRNYAAWTAARLRRIRVRLGGGLVADGETKPKM